MTILIEIHNNGDIMKIFINGKKESIELERVSVIKLLKVKDVEMPEMVSVQLNGSILNKDDFDTTFIQDDDQIDFLYFMGGGMNPKEL